MTNADAIASTLRDAGIDRVFGLPGGEIVIFLEACRKAGVRFYLTGHETSAAFMAAITGQLTGRPGVCVTTLGPGAMNLALGLANARLDRDPVLAITPTLPKALEPHFPHQRLPLSQLFGQICKTSAQVTGVGTADLVRACLTLAATPAPGPVHLALPTDLASEHAQDNRKSVSISGGSLPLPPSEQSHRLREIADALRHATRPLLAVGVGCSVLDLPNLRQFLKATGMPFIVTPKVKGFLPEDAPGFLGVICGMAVDRLMVETLKQADLLFGVGFDPVECDKAWYLNGLITNLTPYPTAEGDYAPIESIGSIGPQLDLLTEEVSRKEWPEHEVAGRRAAVLGLSPLSSEQASPLEAIRGLRRLLPRNTIMTCDVGSHKYFVGQFWESYKPHTFFMSNGLSAMGYGIPAAIAAKLHFPNRPVVSIVGDGGMLMMQHNLVFMRQYDVPVIVVCFADNSLSLIRIAQERRGLQTYGVDFPAPDFARIAEACGIVGVRVKTVRGLIRAVDKALTSNTATVINVPVSVNEYRTWC